MSASRSCASIPDWEFAGLDHFEEMQSQQGGAILLTAHMGSYDLGAQLSPRRRGVRMVMVRAPETDPDTRRYEEELHGAHGAED